MTFTPRRIIFWSCWIHCQKNKKLYISSFTHDSIIHVILGAVFLPFQIRLPTALIRFHRLGIIHGDKQGCFFEHMKNKFHNVNWRFWYIRPSNNISMVKRRLLSRVLDEKVYMKHRNTHSGNQRYFDNNYLQIHCYNLL